MPVYIKKISTKDPRFAGRQIQMFASKLQTSIPVPDTVVLCDGCNQNIFPNDGYLVYLGKRELTKDQPYDFYCEECVKRYFPKAQVV